MKAKLARSIILKLASASQYPLEYRNTLTYKLILLPLFIICLTACTHPIVITCQELREQALQLKAQDAEMIKSIQLLEARKDSLKLRPEAETSVLKEKAGKTTDTLALAKADSAFRVGVIVSYQKLADEFHALTVQHQILLSSFESLAANYPNGIEDGDTAVTLHIKLMDRADTLRAHQEVILQKAAQIGVTFGINQGE